MLGPKGNVGPKKMWVPKDIGSQKMLSSLNVWLQIKFGFQKCWVLEKCRSQNNLVPKNVGPINCGSQKC